jgi:hypothetical protein
MSIIVGLPKEWEDISKNQGMGGGLPSKVSTEPRWQFEGACNNEMSVRPLGSL